MTGGRRYSPAQLEQIAGGYPSREKFLTELTLDPLDSTTGRAGPPLRDEELRDPLDDPLPPKASNGKPFVIGPGSSAAVLYPQSGPMG